MVLSDVFNTPDTKPAHRPAPRQRRPQWVPSVAALYGQVPLRQENSYFSIGERCNANGSKKWRELQEKGDWDGCVAMGREQIEEGSHSLDICTAFVGRDDVQHHPDRGRLAGAVGAEQAVHRAARNGERESVDGGVFGIPLRDAPDVEGEVGHGSLVRG